MATVTKTYTENLFAATSSTWTLTFTGVNATASGTTFTMTSPTVTAKYVGSNKGRAYTYVKLSIYNGPTDVEYSLTNTYAHISWASGESKTVTKIGTHTATHNTAWYFTSSNKTSRTVNVACTLEKVVLESDNAKNTNINSYYADSSVSLGTIATITLDAPPTFTAAVTSSGTYYSNVSTYKVNVSDLSAKYGGTISNVTLTIGNQTASRTTNGELSIALDSAGTFTPTVTVTDSRGQTTTKQMPAITVNAYAAPTVLFSVERTQSNGKPDDESTTHATIVASFKFTNAVATLTAPTVTVNGTSVSPTWYSTRAADGTLSGSITWSSVKNTDTVYGVISGTYAIGDSYTVGITPKDNKRTGGQVTALLPPAFFTIDFLAGGKGITFGQLATQVGFWCAMDMYLHGHKVPVFYESASAPTASEGENGDVWIQYS